MSFLENLPEPKILVLIALLGIILFYFYFLREKPESNSQLETQYNEILNSDKYKVKGQW